MARVLIVTSTTDPASANILRNLLDEAAWERDGVFEGVPSYRRGDLRLVTLREAHLERDHLDRDVAAATGEAPDLVVYASRHRSESGIPTLTVHPLGNLGAEAKFGGIPNRLVPAAPHAMTEALRVLKGEAEGLDFAVSFEATHHGPYLETPSFYIELGSDETAWEREAPARAIARTLLRLRPAEHSVALGLGGGHYVPRLTDVALRRRVSFGHMIPSYALPDLDEAMLRQAMARSPGVSVAYLHRKAVEASLRSRVEALVREAGLGLVREADLAPR